LENWKVGIKAAFKKKAFKDAWSRIASTPDYRADYPVLVNFVTPLIEKQ
jgi:hypothetical protein